MFRFDVVYWCLTAISAQTGHIMPSPACRSLQQNPLNYPVSNRLTEMAIETCVRVLLPVVLCCNDRDFISGLLPVVLRCNDRDFISGLFVMTSHAGAVSTNLSGSVAGLEGGSSLRRVSSARRTFTSGMSTIKRRSICAQVKFQMVSLIFLHSVSILMAIFQANLG